MKSVVEEILTKLRERSAAADDELCGDDFAEKITDVASELWDTNERNDAKKYRQLALEIAALGAAAVQWLDRNYDGTDTIR